MIPMSRRGHTGHVVDFIVVLVLFRENLVWSFRMVFGSLAPYQILGFSGFRFSYMFSLLFLLMSVFWMGSYDGMLLFWY